MKEVKHFICDICGTEYKDKNACSECERGHYRPLEISGAKFVSMKSNRSGYPTQVRIKMSNGEIITYKK